ncbi:arylamine N-acetyltransferase [Fulvivirga kasyanovii]|uniref:Acetyltransferase n=1 Tax=Fulvivirga kasyanovii TaxID=396812 RepID=A0ABW9RXR9_9BACT|nr:arylamine N-acetyltransferase [Fulvivirga kasyanovii]MTI27993.1 acetyltransferase [Fulvivirga kasyanovii]
MNKEEYLNKIGYEGVLEPTLEVLKHLQKAHLLNIPFENLDIHFGHYIELDVDKIYRKVVAGSRGGFCYELNGLFYELLFALGYKTKRISARVFDSKKGYSKEYDHLAVIVEIDGDEYLTDVGFGEFTFAPLKIEPDSIQHDERGNFMVDMLDENWFRVSKIEGKQVVPQYIFKNIDRAFSEFSEMCQYHQSSPESHFTQKRLISRPTENGRITITGNRLKIKAGEEVTETELDDEAAFDRELWHHFGVKVKHQPGSVN